MCPYQNLCNKDLKDQSGFLQLKLPQRCCAGCEGFTVSQLLGQSNPRLYLRQIALTMACCSAAGLPPESSGPVAPRATHYLVFHP